MEDPLYRELILDHAQQPRNVGVLTDASLDCEAVNPSCGDKLRITATLDDGVVQKIAFTGEGCAISTAAASLLTEHVSGKPLRQITNLPDNSLLEQLGLEFVTPARRDCALLAFRALARA